MLITLSTATTACLYSFGDEVRRFRTQSKIVAQRKPLAPTTYLFRNASKTLPLLGVILLAVTLVAGIVSMINSITLSIKTIYSYSKEFVGVTPRGDTALTDLAETILRDESPVPIERLTRTRAASAVVQSIVGKWQFAVLGLKPDDLEYLLKRVNTTHLDGRVPAPGAPEALITEPVSRNLGKKLGDILMGPNETDYYSPKEVKIVGIAHSNQWLMLSSYDYIGENHFPPIDYVMAFAPDNAEQKKQLDKWAFERFKSERVRALTWQELEQETDTMFTILFKILNVVIGMLVLVITLMMGLLINIYQSQRLVEFGLLQAIGYTKKQLLGRVFRETTFVVFGGWIIGAIFAYALLRVTGATLMHPQAFALDPLDPVAYRYTIPIPFAILATAFLSFMVRFRKFDPVAIVERRLV